MIKITPQGESGQTIKPLSYVKGRGLLARLVLPITRWLRARNAERYMLPSQISRQHDGQSSLTACRHLDIGCGDLFFLRRSKCTERFGLDKLLGDDGPVFEPVPVLSPEEVISLIGKAGGVTSLAHPGSTSIDSEIPRLAKAGLGGIEVCNTQHTKSMEFRYRGLAEQYGLVMTGGSDTHGAKMCGRKLGNIKLNYDHVERLKKMAAIVASETTIINALALKSVAPKRLNHAESEKIMPSGFMKKKSA